MEVLNSPAAVSSPYPRAEHNATEVRGFNFRVSGFKLLCYLVTLLLCYLEQFLGKAFALGLQVRRPAIVAPLRVPMPSIEGKGKNSIGKLVESE